MSKLKILTAEVFTELLKPARYKGAYGGRASGKSHFFAEMMVDDAMRIPGLRCVCIREVQKSLKESAKRLIEDKIASLRVGKHFRVLKDEIITPGGGVIIFQGMKDHTAESIKSLEQFHRAWWEEAQTATTRSLELLRPTLRSDSPMSEIWFSWNPRSRTDPVDRMFRGEGRIDSGEAICVRASWRTNPWFPEASEVERQLTMKNDPDQYDHIWEGEYITIAKGAYYSRHLSQARREGRIGRVPGDPLLPVHLYCDIGGTGRFSDSFVFWAVQFVHREIRLINYYEVRGQTYEDHIYWMSENGYRTGNTTIHLPHDGTTSDRVMPVSYESVFQFAGYSVTTTRNQGQGAAMARVAAARRLFRYMYFDETACKAGLESLGWYHEKWDEHRNIGLGPEHDSSSHAADAFGLMAITYDGPDTGKANEPLPELVEAY